MKRILSTLLVMLIAVSCFGISASAESAADKINAMGKLSGYEKNQQTKAKYGVVGFEELDSYEEYLNANSDVQKGEEHIVVGYESVVKKTSGVKLVNGGKYQVENGENYKKVVYTGEEDNVVFEVNLKNAGIYNIILNYHTVPGKDISIIRELQINGETPFENAAECTFTRRFKDDIENNKFTTDYLGNELRPEQKEVFCWKSDYIVDYLGYNTEPLQFAFKKGKNTIAFNAVKEPVVIGSVELVEISETQSYDSYIKQYESAKKYDGEETFIEAEHALYKSDKTLYPTADVSTASTSTNGNNTNAYKQSVNVAGGTNWQYPQQSITWQVGSNVKEGLYSLNFKYRQNVNDGMRSPRRLYINGEVPFEEAKSLEFNYTTEWDVYYPQKANGDECLVYLKPGDTITLETTLSEMGGYIETTNETLNEINEIYRQIIKITGTEPDQYRDYQLDELIPDDVKSIGKCADTLQKVVDGIKKYTGESSSGLATIDTLIRQMNKMYEDPDKIGTELSYFKTNISSLGSWINTASYAPLEIDYISLSKPGSEIKDPEVGFFSGLGYSVNRFISSFIVDYNAIGNAKPIDETADDTITVWLATGRDQFQILRQLINNSYTAETGNQVNLELVNTGAVLSSVVAGIGPDVVLDQPVNEPVNYALRNAVYDLKNFKNDKGTEGSEWDLSYDNVLGQFYVHSLKPYMFDRKGNGMEEDIGLYALPEKQEFSVMFYRADVLAAEGIAIPETWDQLISTITALNKKNLEFAMPVSTAVAASSGTGIFYAMLKQLGGDMYADDYKSTALQTDEATIAFKKWTNFYVNYDLPLTYDFKTRFRTGEMPLGIESFTMYNTLAVSAPEINGRWGYTLIPGTERVDENGNTYIDHSSSLSNNCAFILKDNINYDLSWKFLKWWVSAGTQSSFGNQLECVLGPSARYNTANVDAFEQLPWSAEEKTILNEQLTWAEPLPQIAGSYFIDRHINNAFRKVVYKEKDAKDTLYDYSNTINAEITKKRKEFDLPTLDE